MNKFAKILFSIPIFFGMVFIIAVLNSGEKTRGWQQQSPVTFKGLAPNLMVEDMDATILYYREALGFELIMTNPEQKPFDRVTMQRENVILMFRSSENPGNELAKVQGMPAGKSLAFYVNVSNIVDFYQRVKEKTEIKKALYNTFYGTKEFVIRDCNGYLLVFFEEERKR